MMRYTVQVRVRDLIHDADTIYFDLEREVLIFGLIAEMPRSEVAMDGSTAPWV